MGEDDVARLAVSIQVFQSVHLLCGSKGDVCRHIRPVALQHSDISQHESQVGREHEGNQEEWEHVPMPGLNPVSGP